MTHSREHTHGSVSRKGEKSPRKSDSEAEDRSSTSNLASAPAALVLKQTTVFASMTGGSISAADHLRSVAAGESPESIVGAPEEDALEYDVDEERGEYRGARGKDRKTITIMKTIAEDPREHCG